MAKRQATGDALRAALEDALVADPDDLAAHSAYADYLSELGDPRGEFIQTQLALEDAHLPPAERARLEGRERELLARHRRYWLGSLATWVFSPEDEPPSFVRFRRGWVDRVRVDRLTVRTARCLAGAPELRLLRSLVILGCERERPAADYFVPADSPDVDEGSRYPGLSVLAHAKHLGNVRVFGLGDVEGDCQFLTYPDTTHLPAAAARMPNLRELHLNARNLDASTLINTPFLAGLHTLRLERVRLGDEGVRAMARCKWPNLRVLQIWNGRFGDPGASALAKNKSLRSLELLDVSFNYLTPAGVEALKTLGVPVVAEYQMREADDTDDDPADDDEFELDLE